MDAPSRIWRSGTEKVHKKLNLHASAASRMCSSMMAWTTRLCEHLMQGNSDESAIACETSSLDSQNSTESDHIVVSPDLTQLLTEVFAVFTVVNLLTLQPSTLIVHFHQYCDYPQYVIR